MALVRLEAPCPKPLGLAVERRATGAQSEDDPEIQGGGTRGRRGGTLSDQRARRPDRGPVKSGLSVFFLFQMMFPFKETKPANPMLHFFLYFQWTPQSVFVFRLLSLSLSSASVSVCVFCHRVCQLAKGSCKCKSQKQMPIQRPMQRQKVTGKRQMPRQHAKADTGTTFARRSSGLIDKGVFQSIWYTRRPNHNFVIGL